MAMDTGSPTPTPRPTSRARAAASVGADLARRLRREPDDVNRSCPSTRSSRPSGGGASAGWAWRRSTSTRSSAPSTAPASSTATSAPPRAASSPAGSGSPKAMRRGEAMPPIDVYRIGPLHFVRDGHHRVSVARAAGARGDRGLRDRDRHRGRRRRRRAAPRPRAEEPRAALLRAGAAAARSCAAGSCCRTGSWYAGPGRGSRGMGLPRDAGARRVHDPRAGRPRVVRAGVRAGRRRCCARPT